jgi:hypothetical protein
MIQELFAGNFDSNPIFETTARRGGGKTLAARSLLWKYASDYVRPSNSSFNDTISTCQKRGWDRDPAFLGGLEIDP